MLQDMAWRKTPRDLLTNPKIRTIANRVKPELRQAVFAFYVACYMEATEDGVLDLSDTEVFADLIMVEDESIISDLTLQFIRRGFFTALNDECTLIYLEDFDNPGMAVVKNGKRISETADARRQRVQDQLSGGKKKKRKQQQPVEEAPEATDYNDLNDKNEKIVATNDVLRDKFAENVAHFDQNIEREIEREEIEIDTHTQDITDEEEIAAEDLAQIAMQEEEAEDLAQIMQQDTGLTVNTAAESITDLSHNATLSQSDSLMLDEKDSQWKNEDTKKAAKDLGIPDSFAKKLNGLSKLEEWRAAGVFYQFFSKKDAFKTSDSDTQADALSILTIRTSQIAEAKNPPYVIAGQLCKSFEDLVNNRGSFKDKSFNYFSGMPLTPYMLLKPSVFPRVLTDAKKVLSPGKTAGEFWEKTLKDFANEVEKEKKAYNNSTFIDIECQKMGIDLAAPDAYLKYCTTLSKNRN